jgi:molybdopterin biosynthesis enzyme
VRKKDLPELRKLGKQSLYVLKLKANQLHEDDAALQIARAICGKLLRWTKPSEGKTNIVCRKGGLLKIDTAGLLKVNRVDDVIVSTLKNNLTVMQGQTVAATRIIPLVTSQAKIRRIESIASRHQPLLDILPFKKCKVGAVVTGSEIYQGLIKDEFDRYVGEKIVGLGSRIFKKVKVPDDADKIAAEIVQMKNAGCNLIVTTGGMSVDPDDITRKGIRLSGARIIFYGTPILPGAMFLYALLDGVPILGLPACVFFHANTVFDILLPRVLAGDPITKDEIAELGHGGLCMNCQECRYPVCTFGK